jgi:hypothetical protein
MRGPATRMDVLTPQEIDAIVDYSSLTEKYNKEIDRRSAYEILSDKINLAKEKERREEIKEKEEKERKVMQREIKRTAPKSIRKAQPKRKTASDDFGTTLIKELTRGLFGVLGMKRKR